MHVVAAAYKKMAGNSVKPTILILLKVRLIKILDPLRHSDLLAQRVCLPLDPEVGEKRFQIFVLKCRHQLVETMEQK